MIFNTQLPKGFEVYSGDSGQTSIISGTNTTRVFDLTNIPDYKNLTVDKIYVNHRTFTYDTDEDNYAATITYTYTASTGILVMTCSSAILNTDITTADYHWNIIIDRR